METAFKVAIEIAERVAKIFMMVVAVALAVGIIALGIEGIGQLWSWIHEPFSLTHQTKNENGIDELKAIGIINEIFRNRSWTIWMVASAVGLIVGISLTWWGKKIEKGKWETQEKQWRTQGKTHSHERYEKTATMLGDPLTHVRVAGCRGLENLANDDKNMRSLCVRLLFSYLSSPYLSPEEKKRKGQKKLENFFKPYEDLREDIQTAANSISSIYRQAYKEGVKIDDEIISLPAYFLLRPKKNAVCLAGGKISLPDVNGIIYLRKAELQGAEFQNAALANVILESADLRNTKLNWTNLQDAKFEHAKLQGADFERADLQNANLKHAKCHGANFYCANMQNVDLTGADLTDAKLEYAENLKAKQIILRAEWGRDENGKGEAPTLPEELMRDETIQEWCKTPNYEWKRGELIRNYKPE